MQKIRLNDETEFEVIVNFEGKHIEIPIESIEEFPRVYSKLTKQNLSNFTIYNDSDTYKMQLTNKKVSKSYISKVDDVVTIAVELEDVLEVELQMEKTQAKLDYLAMILGVEL
ncbi:MAG: hypothetical protein H2184_16335 [Candidatus Galacturonibacter soehngenii]|nr:hypothetical protein [Candidatus Galacturonibacter soehngenii]